ncbi:MAG TPA: phospholipase D-like domain-containing protein [Gemmatimonadaceae bacterium]|nr:phospholipase D-like domain-containing protein [Gemmatimonadaceae bacterium]
MRRMVKIIGLVAAGGFLLFLAYIGLLYSTRGTPITSVRSVGGEAGAPGVGDPQFLRTVELLTNATLKEGNAIEVAINGDQTYPRLFEDLQSAQRSIALQFYFMNPGRLADRLKDVLLDRARAGVRILFLHDAFGSQNMPRSYLDSLRDGGVEVSTFRPVHWYSLHKAQSRSHIRVVTVDGSVGWTGGFGIDDKWLGDGRTNKSWRDTNVRFQGPAVMQLEATFAAGWAEATGTLITGDIFFPPEGFQSDGHQRAALLHTAPTIGSTPAERLLALTIASARHRLFISNSYFVPDDDFRRLLVAAAQRGVDVRILTTSDVTDVKTTWHAGRAHYENLLEGGVRVFEYQPSMMHAKTFVADGLWASVGTANFDNRSLVFNDESALLALDENLGTQLEAIFMEDLEYSTEITLETFRKRPWTNKVMEFAASKLGRIL